MNRVHHSVELNDAAGPSELTGLIDFIANLLAEEFLKEMEQLNQGDDHNEH